MSDVVQQSITKLATRVLANPIMDADLFEAIVDTVVTANPFT